MGFQGPNPLCPVAPKPGCTAEECPDPQASAVVGCCVLGDSLAHTLLQVIGRCFVREALTEHPHPSLKTVPETHFLSSALCKWLSPCSRVFLCLLASLCWKLRAGHAASLPPRTPSTWLAASTAGSTEPWQKVKGPREKVEMIKQGLGRGKARNSLPYLTFFV